MIPLPLREVAAITGGVLHSPTGDDVSGVVVDGPVVTDSREAGPGGLFVARSGEHADGHDFVFFFVDRIQHRRRREQRNLVLAATPAKKDPYPEFFHSIQCNKFPLAGILCSTNED